LKNKHIKEDNYKVQDIDMDLIPLTKDRTQLKDAVNMTMNPPV
jgi:hypothetical protein